MFIDNLLHCNLALADVFADGYALKVEAAFFAMGRLCELSTTFAAMSFDQVVVMVNAMETSPKVQRLAIRIFAKVGLSPSLSSQAQKVQALSDIKFNCQCLVCR
jgi:hypothetical protein